MRWRHHDEIVGRVRIESRFALFPERCDDGVTVWLGRIWVVSGCIGQDCLSPSLRHERSWAHYKTVSSHGNAKAVSQALKHAIENGTVGVAQV